MGTLLTSVAQYVSIPWFASPFTVTSFFVTRRVIQTVTTAVVDTVVTICAVLPFCSNEKLYLYLYI